MEILDESKKFEYQTCMGPAIPGELPRIKGSYRVGGRIYDLAKLDHFIYINKFFHFFIFKYEMVQLRGFFLINNRANQTTI